MFESHISVLPSDWLSSFVWPRLQLTLCEILSISSVPLSIEWELSFFFFCFVSELLLDTFNCTKLRHGSWLLSMKWRAFLFLWTFLAIRPFCHSHLRHLTLQWAVRLKRRRIAKMKKFLQRLFTILKFSISWNIGIKTFYNVNK